MEFVREPDNTVLYIGGDDIYSLTWNLRGRDVVMSVIVGGGYDDASGYTDFEPCRPHIYANTIDAYSHVRIMLRDSRWNFLSLGNLSERLRFLGRYWHEGYGNGFCVPIEHVNDILRELDGPRPTPTKGP